jgi:hypothetical protein
MEAIKAYPQDNLQIKALKAFMKALKIKFEILTATESPYNSAFVAKIKKGQEDIAEGRGIKMSVAEFKELCK